jgi:hypothetical protein
MKSSRPEYTPVNGKTYSLFGEFFLNSVDLDELEKLVEGGRVI